MPLGEVRTGKKAILGDKKAKGGRFASYINWKDEDTKTLYFITPIDEVMRIMMHQFVKKVVETDDGGEKDIWLNFMCRKDPAWLDESGGECQLCDEIGHKAVEKVLAIAVEVEPVMDGKRFTGVEVKTHSGTDREGNEKEYPNVGIVTQSAHNFFQYLLTQSERRDISDTSWEITREGTGLTTKYNFYPVEFAPNLDDVIDHIPDLYDYVSDLGSAERYERELEGVKAEDQQVWGKGKGRRARSSSSSTTGDQLLFDQMKEAIEKNKGTKPKVEPY